MTVRVRFTEFVKDSEDLENSNLFVFVHIKFEMFEFVWEGKIWRMTPLNAFDLYYMIEYQYRSQKSNI